MKKIEDQITALAREYAEECIDPCGFSDDTFKELVDEKAEMAAYILHWLCKRYCLVEKNRVTELYKSELLNKRVDAYYGVKNDVDAARLDLLKSLFPEIAKGLDI